MQLEEIREFCLSLPGTTEDIKWEDHLCFSVGAKMYLITDVDGRSFTSLKVKDDDFDALTSTENIIGAPYMARNKWIQVQAEDRFTVGEWQHYIRQSYELVKRKLPKKLQNQIDGL